jgi:hypothetical protein
MKTEQYVLEWSKKQGYFHIQLLDKTIATNCQAFADNKTLNDYHIIAIGTFDQMHDAADLLRDKLESRRKEYELP